MPKSSSQEYLGRTHTTLSVSVLTCQTFPIRTGSIASRAENLDRILQHKARGRGINLMAHSMGGLDCRHLITHVQPTEYVPLSLTSISTPHRGSPFMDWCAVSLVPFISPRKDTDENRTTTSNISVSDADNMNPRINARPTSSDKLNQSRIRHCRRTPTARPRNAKRRSVYRDLPFLPRSPPSSSLSSTHPHTQT